MTDLGNTEAVGAIAGILIAAALWLRKLKPSFAQDDKIAAAANADTGIIERLEKECKRLSDQNDKLAKTLNEFQIEVMEFRRENNRLAVENAALQSENVRFREEITELRSEVEELGEELLKMRYPKPACRTCPNA